jgi:hypothetical protein
MKEDNNNTPASKDLSTLLGDALLAVMLVSILVSVGLVYGGFKVGKMLGAPRRY